jgi:hypothetical protein
MNETESTDRAARQQVLMDPTKNFVEIANPFACGERSPFRGRESRAKEGE